MQAPQSSAPAQPAAVPPEKAQASTISLTLVGPASWRDPMTRWLEYESGLALVAEIDPANRPKHVFDLPASEVVIAFADAKDPDPAVELALELQAKNRGTGIILVLSGLREDMARRFSAYAGSWSLITSRTSVDPVKLTVVISSSARGMPVVEPAVTKMLEAGWGGMAVEEPEPGEVSDIEYTDSHKAA